MRGLCRSDEHEMNIENADAATAVVCLEIGFVLWSDELTLRELIRLPPRPEACWLALPRASGMQCLHEPQGVQPAVTPYIWTLSSHRCHNQFS